MNNPWTHIVKALEPDYDRIYHMLKKGPVIKCKVHCTSKVAIMQIVELYENNDEDLLVDENTKTFDTYINLIEEELKNWQGVRRMAYDQWYFKSKKQAEKFQVFFNLKWTN
ncbi:MAG: hypothetical protein EBU90_09685 [Proteobacteria bacterium]|nr:hypothetical protein [Pseudomonadota bacterium]NBP16277.1 hypothetical protein [bacterium]